MTCSVGRQRELELVRIQMISNAIKYTEPGGTISVNLSLIFDSDDDNILEELWEDFEVHYREIQKKEKVKDFNL